MRIRGYYPKSGKGRRYTITEDGYNRIGSVSISSDSGNYKYHVWWTDEEGHSLEGTVYRDTFLGFTRSQRSRAIRGYSFRPLYVNGYYAGSKYLPQGIPIPGVFTSKGQWPCIIEAIKFAQRYPVEEDEKEDRKWGSWLIGGIIGFITSLFVVKKVKDD